MKKLVIVLGAAAAFVYRMVRLLTPAAGEMASGAAAEPIVAVFASLVTAAVVAAVLSGAAWLIEKIRKK